MESRKTIVVLGAGGYMAGPIMQTFRAAGYKIVALVRPSTDATATKEIADKVVAGDLADATFVERESKGCFAIVNFVNQLMPPKDTMREQLENDLGPVKAGLVASLAHDAVFIHSSGNFSIPTRGKIGGRFTNELTAKPANATMEDEHWDTFTHEGGMEVVSMLAEAKHRQDHYVQDFVKSNPASKARVVIPAGVYGPGIGNKISFWDFAAAQYLQGQFGDFKHAFIHIDDIAKVYVAALERGKPGGRYAAYGEPMTIREFVGLYAQACGTSVQADGPRCAEKEALRFYDDAGTREEFGIKYDKTVAGSITAAVVDLQQRGLLLVKTPDSKL